VIYVGSADSDRYDQELDTVLVGPVPIGMSKFVLQVRLCYTLGGAVEIGLGGVGHWRAGDW
jgi:hypothetical protein